LIATAITTAIVIAARFVWMFPATYIPRWLSPALRKRDPRRAGRQPFFLAFTGVRGVVSLAAALAIPLYTIEPEPFPQRDLILFVTFGVIVVTLVGQGLMLPSVVRWLGLPSRRLSRTADASGRPSTRRGNRRWTQRCSAWKRSRRNGNCPTQRWSCCAPSRAACAAAAAKHRRRAGLRHRSVDLRIDLIDAERRFPSTSCCAKAS
jgi:CPA1 family monovalent cation:H+ antiporter